MGFQPSASSFSKTRLVVLLVALAATAFLGAYHLRQARTTQTFARPAMSAAAEGPVLVEGAAGGTPFALADGTNVLVAQIEVWDRPPSRKGSTVVCSRVLVERLTVGDHPIVWDAAATTPSTRPFLIGGDHVGYIDLSRELAPLPVSKLGTYCGAATVAKARHVVVRAVLPGDTVTATGCAKNGDVVACRDGYDILSGRDRAGAEGKIREGLVGFLLLATFLGCPSLVALLILLSQRTASLARPAKAAVS